MPYPTIIGVTGAIGSGKTTVSRYFEELGARYISADEIAHDILRDDHMVWKRVVNRFGSSVLDDEGLIDRARLASMVFQDEEARHALEAIIHPEVRKRLEREIESIRFEAEPPPAVVVEMPLLVEADMSRLVDLVAVVVSSDEEKVKRACRKGISPQEAEKRLRCQTSDEERLKVADYVVRNDADLDSLQERVGELWAAIQNSGPPRP